MSRGTARSNISIGRCLRAFSALSTRPLPMIGSGLGRGAHDDVVQRKLRRQVVERDDAPEKALGQVLRARFGAIGERRWLADDARRSAPRRARSFRPRRRRGRSGSRCWDRCARRAAPRRKPSTRCSRRCRFRVRTVFATENVRWKSLFSNKPERAGGFGGAHRVLELAEDLRLAQHHASRGRSPRETRA